MRLEEAGIFDDLDMSFPCEGGSMPFNVILGFRKDEILSLLKKQGGALTRKTNKCLMNGVHLNETFAIYHDQVLARFRLIF